GLDISINNIVSAHVDHWHYDTFRGSYEKEWYGKLNVVLYSMRQEKYKPLMLVE
ncbi:MAG: hypothetical protein HC811_12480, partial [Flammeovirgaceae bacterium]|nr:hypothetical protein [Flammeovirgaceae bacterium]